ncbi:MAG: hypothetical protein OXC02_02450 [Rhodobacteraceae bacterium]|nr:hypothetical protein [Paracoccaceae bacterium]
MSGAGASGANRTIIPTILSAFTLRLRVVPNTLRRNAKSRAPASVQKLPVM